MRLLILSAVFYLAGLQSGYAVDLNGKVEAAKDGIADAEVILWQTNGKQGSEQIATTKTDESGGFQLSAIKSKFDNGIYYLTSKGGHNGHLELMAVIGEELPGSAVINELTTVASTFTNAQFISNTTLAGNELGLKIAAGNVKNFANVETGEWGRVVTNPNNLTVSTSLARLNTLSNLIALCAIPSKSNYCDEFLELSSSENPTTLDVIQYIAKETWNNSDKLFDLFSRAYPAPKSENPQVRRADVTYVPYLSYAPKDFALFLKFTDGGVFAGGRVTFDSEGNMWSGQNWTPGSQSGVIKGIGGGIVKLAPDGSALSPNVTGFTGMGIDGVGWGTGVDLEKVWVTTFNNTIGVFDFDGQPLGPKEGITLDGQIGEGQGVGVAMNGDVWIADSSNAQLVYFAKGDPTKGKIIKVKGVTSPFGIVINNQNQVWVSNSRSNLVVMFPADSPDQAKQFVVGDGVRGIALDSKGNVWVASTTQKPFPVPTYPTGKLSIMEEFLIGYTSILKNASKLPTGVISMIRPDGTQVQPEGYVGDKHQVNVPWGISVDGNDNIWVGNFEGASLVYMCGIDISTCPEGMKTGDVIHNFENGSVQMLTDASIDSAGNVWIANNWENGNAVIAKEPLYKQSTKTGGTGMIVFYGIAKPVKTPLIGKVRKP